MRTEEKNILAARATLRAQFELFGYELASYLEKHEPGVKLARLGFQYGNLQVEFEVSPVDSRPEGYDLKASVDKLVKAYSPLTCGGPSISTWHGLTIDIPVFV
jgi:hypothetical protein